MKNNLAKYDNDEFLWSNWLRNFFELPFINNSNVLKTNIRKEGNNYVYEIDVPGYDKDDVHVNYEEGYIIVDARTSNTIKNNSSQEGYIRQERYSGSCSRSFYIGDIDENKISAKYNNGVLCIRFPIQENEQKSKIKQINIE